METETFTLSVFTENYVGLLNRLAIILTRRKINISTLNTSESEIEGVYRFTILIEATEEQVIKVTKQLEKVIDVLKAFYHKEKDTVYQEIALYKIHTANLSAGQETEKLLRKHNARVLAVEPDFAVIEKTGHKSETTKLFEDLKQYGVLEFTRSGRVAITKPMKVLSKHLDELEESVNNQN